MVREKWIRNKEALRIAKGYPKGPHSYNALKFAGLKFNFMRKTDDGFHWEYEKKKLVEYCEISNKPTLLDIAKKIDRSVGFVTYVMLKNNIRHHEKMGRKFLEEKDREKFLKIYEDEYVKK